jgi:hypothetical protein
MAKYVSHGGFTDQCKAFHRAKGIVQPQCGCNACWDTFFRRNPTKTAAATLALKTFGTEPIILAQGKDHADELEQRETFEIYAGIRKFRSDYVAAARRRGTKYLQKLQRWISENPEQYQTAEVAA